ncbi:hypothetical protein R5R35_014516 [Gryllus longicercus]|uniref:Uncharacterized protein n=1 Tax=Gryllus longicercus TaxID=2509291 RepID=A0AAN9Z2L0_9ORTH
MHSLQVINFAFCSKSFQWLNFSLSAFRDPTRRHLFQSRRLLFLCEESSIEAKIRSELFAPLIFACNTYTREQGEHRFTPVLTVSILCTSTSIKQTLGRGVLVTFAGSSVRAQFVCGSRSTSFLLSSFLFSSSFRTTPPLPLARCVSPLHIIDRLYARLPSPCSTHLLPPRPKASSSFPGPRVHRKCCPTARRRPPPQPLLMSQQEIYERQTLASSIFR